MSHRLPFLNIRTEGALLPSDLLSRLMEGTNLPGLKPEDYHLGADEKLNEATSRSWTRLLSLWAGFRKAKEALPASDLGTTLTREKWLLQLFQELGYGRLIGASPFEIDGKSYPISHVWQGQYYQLPIHLVSFRADLDKRSEQRIQGASKASPHGMVQEFLNRSGHDLWALVSNGLKLVILRDNASLTRQAHVDFDLEGIFESEAYADFRLLWMVCHQSRLEGTAKDRPETCWLELWSKQAETEGRRALDQLRDGVQRALESLGTGFISHKSNQNLCQRLKAGELNKQDLYRQLLRLVYRLIFLFVAEDRDLLHSPGASEDARLRYARFYSGQRLRRMAERTRGSRHADLWVGLRLVFARLGDDRGCPVLGLPALGGFLFGPEAMPELESAELANEHLLLAIRNLGLVKDRSGWRLVDYRNLGSEELGSVYESLLELNPIMELDAGVFSLSTVAGNQRKTSGSYYTPDSLVQCLLDSALDPVVEQVIKGKTAAEAEKAILALKVCDPAVGSGHFLVGAAHRLAKHLGQVRAQAQGESEPSPLYYQHALRDVIGHCLYGVDVNPMAAELCRVSLWLEAIEPGKPLSFLDHHIRVGNSLLGTTPALLAKGIPDEAFTPIEGDDKEICNRFKKVNKTEKIGYRRLFAATTEPWERLGDLATSMVRLDNAPDDSIEAVRNKERMYEAMVRSGNYVDGQFWADTWCAAFVWKKTQEFNHPITEEDFRRIEHNPHACDLWMRNEIVRLSQQYRFFHWHLAFPDVFHVPMANQEVENDQTGWSGGFDVVLGNPPWVRQELLKDAKNLLTQFDSFSGTADLAVYFLERGVQISRLKGHLGLLTPNKWFVAEYGRSLRVFLRLHTRISLLIDFGHSKSLFPDADTFPAAVVLERKLQPADNQATFSFVRALDADRDERGLKDLVAHSSQTLPHGLLNPERWQMAELRATSLIEAICQRGTPLTTVVGKPLYRGVLTGFNKAFVISESTRRLLIAADPRSEEVIKPWLSGREIRRWTPERGEEYVIFTRRGLNLSLYPAIYEHLSRWKDELTPRVPGAPRPIAGDGTTGRKPGTYKWYEIQDNVAYYEEFNQPKLVFQEIAFHSQFALDTTGLFCNKTVHIIPTADLYILGVLNSRISWWLMNHLFPHMKDGALLLQGSMISQFPIPEAPARLRSAISEVVQSILNCAPSAERNKTLMLELELNDLVNTAFGIEGAQRDYIVANLPLRDPITVLTGTAHTDIPDHIRPSAPPADAAVAHPWPEEIIQVAAVSKEASTENVALPDEAWATPVGVTPENVALFSLIDILRAIGEAVDPERVRFAAILVRKPMLAAAFMDDAQAKQWLRLIGQEARPERGNVVQISQFQKNGVDYPWAEAIRQLRGSGALVVDSDGKWSAGDRMPASSRQDWITGRASIAVQLLSSIDPAQVEQKLIAFNRSVQDGTARRAVS